MLRVAAFAAALMALCASASARDFPRIRTENTYVRSLIGLARDQSPTFARMIDKLEQSNVIVYIEADPHLDGRLRGCVHFIGAAAGFRYVRVRVRTSMNRIEVVSSIAHELQHAIEIVDHPEVEDEDGLAQLYRRIGSEHDWQTFDTAGAERAGRLVRAEVFGS